MQPTQPGVDWNDVRSRWECGDSSHQISKDYPITRQAIDKRAKKEGWKRGVANVTLSRDQRRAAATLNNDSARPVLRGKRTPENARRAVELRKLGMTQEEIAKALGMSPSNLSQWLNSDESFLTTFHDSYTDFKERHLRVFEEAAARGDWRASDRRLQIAEPATYGGGTGEKGGVTVVLNINRDEQVEINPVIEHTPPSDSEN